MSRHIEELRKKAWEIRMELIDKINNRGLA